MKREKMAKDFRNIVKKGKSSRCYASRQSIMFRRGMDISGINLEEMSEDDFHVHGSYLDAENRKMANPRTHREGNAFRLNIVRRYIDSLVGMHVDDGFRKFVNKFGGVTDFCWRSDESSMMKIFKNFVEFNTRQNGEQVEVLYANCGRGWEKEDLRDYYIHPVTKTIERGSFWNRKFGSRNSHLQKNHEEVFRRTGEGIIFFKDADEQWVALEGDTSKNVWGEIVKATVAGVEKYQRVLGWSLWSVSYPACDYRVELQVSDHLRSISFRALEVYEEQGGTFHEKVKVAMETGHSRYCQFYPNLAQVMKDEKGNLLPYGTVVENHTEKLIKQTQKMLKKLFGVVAIPSKVRKPTFAEIIKYDLR